MQFIHEDDVGQALLLCILADGPPGAYNIAGDGVLTGGDVARELGLAPLPVPGASSQAGARGGRGGAVRRRPPAEWAEAVSHPAIMDTRKAKQRARLAPRHSEPRGAAGDAERVGRTAWV